MKPLVIYHKHCTDGFGAAFAAWLKLGDDAEYLPMEYGTLDLKQGESFNQTKNYHKGHRFHPDNIRERDVYILDFSFSRETMLHLFENAKQVVWLDHHKTAFEMWGDTNGLIVEQDSTRHICLDNNKSGALLAWEYFHPGSEVPLLIQHIDDRDRWQFKLEGSKELHAALWSYKPWSFEQWKNILTRWIIEENTRPFSRKLLGEGAAILRAKDAHVQSMVEQARKCSISTCAPQHGPDIGDSVSPSFSDGYLRIFSGLAANATLHQSEVGDELANQSGTYGLVWYVGDDLRVRCSLRSNGDYDVSGIARAFGGGGHRNAAGFETDITTLMGWLK